MKRLRPVAAILCTCLIFGCSQAAPAKTAPAATSATTTSETSSTSSTSASETSDEDIEVTPTGYDPSVFACLGDDIEVRFGINEICQSGTVNGRDYSLTIDLNRWNRNTTLEQTAELSRLFWQVYPKLYERFGVISDAPVDVNLLIENEGYEIAEAWDNNVHIHDMWLHGNPEDYDCFAHELAHVIQHGWDGQMLEYDSYIERFADYCRYVYALDDGAYNDRGWTLQTVEDEPDRESSVRFLVWLDYMISGDGRDFMREFFEICTNGLYGSDEWASVWDMLFTGTGFEGMAIDEVWDMYAASDFAMLSSYSDGSKSALLSGYDVRSKLKAL